MFKWFRKDPIKALEIEYGRKLEEARDLQRRGDIIGYARKSAEADELLQKLQSAEKQ